MEIREDFAFEDFQWTFALKMTRTVHGESGF